jgi:hypothetical protein
MIFQYIPEITKSQKSQRERKASQSGANSLNVFEGFEDRFAQGGREAGSAIEQSGSKAGNALAAKLSAAGDQFAASIAGRIFEAIDRCRREGPNSGLPNHYRRADVYLGEQLDDILVEHAYASRRCFGSYRPRL